MSHSSTRQIALRAAIAVTGLALPGCYDANQNQGDAGPQVDAVVVADAYCDFIAPPTNQPGCEGCGFSWNPSTSSCIAAVPGPFVPPSLEV